MRIVFFGTPEFSTIILNALITAGHEIICVYSQPPRSAGRGQKIQKSAVHIQAIKSDLLVRTPENFLEDITRQEYLRLDADCAVVVAYGLILPKVILDANRLGCFNIHASILPRWRGAAPIQRAIMEGDTITGISIMRMAEGLDTGPVINEVKTKINELDTAGQLNQRLANLGAELIVMTLPRLEGFIETEQSSCGIRYAKKISKLETRVDWAKPAAEVSGLIRGLSPFPGAWTAIDGQRVKLLECRVVSKNGKPGEILDGFTVACSTSAVEIIYVQKPGRKSMSAVDFLRGNKLPNKLF